VRGVSAPAPTDPVLVAACRTAIGTAGHALSAVPAVDLAAPVVAEVTRRASALDLPVAETVLGNCLGPGGNIARSVALAAGLPITTPAVTVDRQCGSGLEAVRLAVASVRLAAMTEHRSTLVLAGGAESASTAPWRFWPPDAPDAPPQRYTRAPFAPFGFLDPDMGDAADDLAARRGISRHRQDMYAERSHRRAYDARAAGRFAAEIIPVAGLDSDERPRRLTLDRLSRLPPAFDRGAISAPADASGALGTVTAGNSSGISDGAAVVAVTTRAAAQTAGLASVAIRSCAVVAGDPALPGAAAGPAAAAALRAAGLTVGDVGAIEITEAFASVALAFADDLGVDPERLCADGGAIALGHPWGASGAILLVRLMFQMLAPGGAEFGLAACAIGGGQGIAMVLQRCDPAGPA